MNLRKRTLALFLTLCLLLSVAVPMVSAAKIGIKIQIGTKGPDNYEVISNPAGVGLSSGTGYEQFKFSKSDSNSGSWVAVRIKDTGVFSAGEYHLTFWVSKINNVEDKGGKADFYLLPDTDKTGAELDSYITSNMTDSTYLGQFNTVDSAHQNCGVHNIGESFIVVIKSAADQTPPNGNDCWVRLATVNLVPIQSCSDADSLAAALATSVNDIGQCHTTIRMTADITTSDITIPKNATLDLNGHTLKATSFNCEGKQTDSSNGSGAVQIVDAADIVQAQINAIGTVTLNSEGAIKAARAAYDALTDDLKAKVNIEALTAAEAKLAELKAAAEKEAADKAAADAVQAKIDAIGTVTLESEDAIKEARAAYDALTDDQKAKVKADALTAAEAALAELKAPAVPPVLYVVLALSLAAIVVVVIVLIRRKKNS